MSDRTTTTGFPSPPGPRGAAPVPDQPSSSSGTRVFLLLAIMAALVVLSIATGSFPAVGFVLALIASVMLHEAGHFVTAKWSGMKVTEFFFGFGPRLWSVRKGETEYGVKAIPAGGYVKIVGMSNLERDIDPADEARTYRAQSFPRRILVAVAGIVTHFVIAFLLLVLMWSAVGVPKASLEVGSISRLETGPSPAEQAGIQVGDKIVAVDGRPVKEWTELPPYIRERPGQPIAFTVERNGQRINITATPLNIAPENEEPLGFVGVGAKRIQERVNPLVGAGRAFQDIGELTVGSVKALGSFFSPSSLSNYGDQLSGQEGAGDNRPLSVVGVVRVADQAADEGLFDFLALLVILNIFVAILNLVPLPPLDGGHIAIAVYERIRSRGGRRYHADMAKLLPIAAAVVVAMVVLGITSVWLDITSPVSNPFQ